MLFFISDGILGWENIKVDDASSFGHEQLAHWKNKTGTHNLPLDSPWRTDLSKYMSIINYQNDATKVEPPAKVSPYAATGKEINETDKLYYKRR